MQDQFVTGVLHEMSVYLCANIERTLSRFFVHVSSGVYIVVTATHG
jgi:hypothetical protein